MQIYKQTIAIEPENINVLKIVEIPGELVSIQKQYNNLSLYFISNPHITNIYEVLLAETGADIKITPYLDYKHMGTFMFYNDTYVLHAFAAFVESIR